MTLCDIVTVFAETKSVTKLRLHCIIVFGFQMNRSAYRCTIEAQNTKKINKQEFPVPFIYFPYLKHKKKQFIQVIFSTCAQAMHGCTILLK